MKKPLCRHSVPYTRIDCRECGSHVFFCEAMFAGLPDLLVLRPENFGGNEIEPPTKERENKMKADLQNSPGNRQSDIPRQLEMLEEICESLRTEIERMEGRLTPILHNEPARAETKCEAPSSITELGARINGVGSIVSSCTHRLRALQTRVEL